MRPRLVEPGAQRRPVGLVQIVANPTLQKSGGLRFYFIPRDGSAISGRTSLTRSPQISGSL